MLTAAEAIERYVERGRAAFDADPALRDAIVYQIVVLGEAAKAVVAADPSLEVELPQVEWSLLAKMRDKVTHQYWAINQEIVWATAEQDIAAIRGLLRGALEELG
ncbi:MAG TPA: HepT-like ribonuclease domain-containing protein [Gemmatimonadales bacterium]|nr:HepT-like ribonuclease domain-containing protein [Gemmatimonadales bacterium]